MSRKMLIPCFLAVILANADTAMAEGGADFGGGDLGYSEEGQTTEGDSSNGGISSEVRYSNSDDDSAPPGVVTPLSDWEPPPCWFEARRASEAQEYVLTMLQNWQNMPEQDIAPSRDRLLDHFERGEPYEDYNLNIEDEGSFWFGVANPNQLEHPGAQTCAEDPPQWVENGETPEDERVITSEMLAASAYEWLPLPETVVRMSPDAGTVQTVNLPTWIWQESGEFGEVSATATLERLGLEATTVATPSALTIDAGTADAIVYPENGECPVNADGTIGEPYYGQSSEEEPPCGVTYLRSTGDAEAYELTATITWSVAWTGTGEPQPQPLPDAVLETMHELDVQEVQTIVR